MPGPTPESDSASSSPQSPSRDERLELMGIPSGEWRTTIGPLLEELGQPAYRGKSLSSWVFQRHAEDFSEMSDLPRSLREVLAGRTILHPLALREAKTSEDGTRKFLWELERGPVLESVFIPDGKRRTFCISTQAGCPVKCTFCATGFGGFDGQLSPAEIVDQVIQLSRHTGQLPTNLVFMGMGEPLLNAPAVYRAIEILTDPDQVGLGARRLTLSTVGIPARIVELGQLHPQVKLAVSLHAPDDALRDELIPLNRKHPLEELLGAIREHHRLTGKKVTLEYILLPGVNDSRDQARALAAHANSTPSRINLIGFNPFPGASYDKPTVARLEQFRQWIQADFPGEILIRRSRGEDIQGACGQLSLLHAAPRP